MQRVRNQRIEIGKLDKEIGKLNRSINASSYQLLPLHTLPLYQRPELIAVRSNLANYGTFGLSSERWADIRFTE